LCFDSHLKNLLREDRDGGLIQKKLKVLFANFSKPGRLDCGLILKNVERFFEKLLEREGRTAG
jgi:hypothetical protein